jgi:hypothetical protein
MHRSRSLGIGLVSIAMWAVVATDAGAEWVADLNAGTVYEDNLSATARTADRRSDVALASTLAAGYYFRLTGATSVQATADARGSLYAEFDRLSHASLGATLGLGHKFGLGPLAPRARLVASGGYVDYRDDVRDTALVTAGGQVGKRIHERVDLEVGYLYERREARDPVFDQDAHTLSLLGSLAVTEALQLTLGYALRLGDLVVHAVPGSGVPPAGPSRLVNTFDTPLVATRIDATAHIFSVLLSYALTAHVAANAGYEYQIAFGPRLNYPNNVVRVSLSYSY